MKTQLTAFLVFISLSNLAACTEKSNSDQLLQAPKETTENKQSIENKQFHSIFPPFIQLSSEQIAPLTADLNGDNTPDQLFMVSINPSIKNSKSVTLPDNVNFVQPWPAYSETDKNNGIVDGSSKGLAIIHGRSKSAYLIFDKNPISLLDTEAAKEVFIHPKSKVVELEDEALTSTARGDIVVIPTEAGIDSYLIWNGTTYQNYEAFDIP